MRPILSLAFLLFSVLVFSQTIKGKITDGVDSQPLPFVTVQIEGTTTGSVADMDGNFVIKVAPGTYTLIASSVGYETQRFENLTVGAQGMTLDIVMSPEEKTLEGVVVTAKKLQDTEGAVIEEVKKAEEVVNAVSSEEISKTEASDAGEVVSRIPGITLIDGKFIIVRGLNQRFNNVKLNGAPMPSTDPSTRAFSFDIIPSSIIESVSVYKSFSPSLAGEVAGAAININTKNFVDENYDKLGVKVGYRVGTTFSSSFSDPSRSAGDWFTFGKGAREWGSEVQGSVVDSRTNPSLNAQQATSFDNTDFFGKSFTAMPDFGVSYGLGRLIPVGDKELSFTGAMSLSNSIKTVEYERARYSIFGDNQAPANFTEESNDFNTVRKARLMAMANFAYEVSDVLDLTFQNLYNRIGSSNVLNRDISNQDQGQDRLVESIDYLDETLLSSQLGATWQLNNYRDRISTVLGFSQTKYDQPNRRAYYRFKGLGVDEPYNFLLPNLGAALIGTTRFSSLMNENSFSLSADYTHQFGEEFDEQGRERQNISVQIGTFGEYRSREFNARNLGYGAASIGGGNPGEFVGDGLQPEDIFLDQNFFVSDGSQRGIVIDEKTQSVDRYEAFSQTLAAYMSFMIPVEKWTFNLGGRFETNTQNITGAEDQQSAFGTLDRDLQNDNFLPFANVAYRFNDKWQMRAAYSSTVNRPELRELAPFAYYDFDKATSAKGNPDLEQSNIQNMDLRLELYPGAAELISLGAFYKSFTNPIEFVNISVNDEFQTVNNKSAIAYGVELEIRKDLSFISDGPVLGNTSFLLNAAWIKSETKLARQNAIAVNENRPLGGQSPYVINSGLYYANPESGWSVNVNYNTYGKRIVVVEGGSDRPPIYELPRQLIDVSIAKNLPNDWEVKLSATNILNAEYRFYFDGDFDEKIDINEGIPVTDQTSPLFQRYEEGQKIEIAFTKRF